jgi:hypothetical protein
MLDADDGGYFERSGKDGGMRRDAARLQRDAGQILVRYQGELRERQLLGDDNRGPRERPLAILLAEMAEHAMADVAEVGGALAQIPVGNREHLSAQFVDYPKQRAFGRVAFLDRVADASDEFLVLEDQAMTVEDLEVRLRHQRFHPHLQRDQFRPRPLERILEPFLLALDVAGALIALDGAQEGADDVGNALREAGRGGQSDQSGPADLAWRLDPCLAADLFVILELAVGLYHPAAILLALLLAGGEGFAEPEMRQDLRDLRRRSAQQRGLGAREAPARQGLRHQHPDGLLPPFLDRNPEKRVESFLAGFGEVFVARMAHRVGDRHRLAFFDHQPNQPLAHAHRHSSDRLAVETHGCAQDQPLALGIEQIQRADLRLHPLGDRRDDLVESFAQGGMGLAGNRGDFLDQGESIAIGSHRRFQRMRVRENSIPPFRAPTTTLAENPLFSGSDGAPGHIRPQNPGRNRINR